MDSKRAQEIMQAHDKIRVHFEGMPIWIDNVDERSKTARVHTMENREDKKTVALSELEEMKD
ncbi:small acid-soluble spore protein H (minor) [Aneurinibacillus soli]|uniref:Small, acid-soluble spore protein H n=1 Tax=Aneurinibacillus soli TaxID=1500254 RepID=A0A0U5AUY1_9BACL|nr:H-type small acid-soluble spore protein [Aneurinibacillus soli]PYE57142.1 small acid-soluble spore protein H (minor) [Aneurinibacillus soli]BAU26002.1 Small, acid-soluble spore protein H [Aneurinibacillus soli]